MKNKLLILTGPTATGKTKLGIELAQKFDGEILSADSRQVYKGMDIGTGKDKELYTKSGVKVWGLDLVDPDYHFNVSDWVKYATTAIRDIQSRGKLPIIVGGTGLYIKSLLNPPQTMRVPVDQKLRDELDKMTVSKLQRELIGIDGNRWKSMNESDRKNPRRLVRAIEVTTQSQKSKIKSQKYKSKIKSTDVLIIGLTTDREFINQRINQRVEERMMAGMEEEAKKLINRGYSWNLPSMSGIGYREFVGMDRNKLEQIVNRWKIAEHQYAKRQLTYLRKYLPDAKWFDISSARYINQIRKLVHNFVE